MENILKEIDIEIKKIVSNESEIDTGKLRELIDTKERLKGYSITSLSRIQEFDNPVNQAAFRAYGIHQNNSMIDNIQDIANMFLKKSKEQIDVKNIINLMDYHRFISCLSISSNETINNERLNIKDGIERLIMKELKTIIEEKKIEKKNTEKDKILETTAETKIETPL